MPKQIFSESEFGQINDALDATLTEVDKNVQYLQSRLKPGRIPTTAPTLSMPVRATDSHELMIAKVLLALQQVQRAAQPDIDMGAPMPPMTDDEGNVTEG